MAKQINPIDQEMLSMILTGKTLSDVGRAYNLSRERIRQRMKRLSFNIKEFRKENISLFKKHFNYTCPNCNRKFIALKENNKFCTKECIQQFKIKNGMYSKRYTSFNGKHKKARKTKGY